MFGGPRKAGGVSHNFNQVPSANIPRSAFDRSHSYRATFNSSQLVPFYVDEALPGDTFKLSAATFARLTTPIKPLYDNLYLDMFFFAVPYRLVWTHWEQFNGAQLSTPSDSTNYLVPVVTAPVSTGVQVGETYDFMGIPTGIASISFNNLHNRAYNLIWNEWFRDENLQSALTVDTGDGPDTYGNYNQVAYRCKPHDYFTSCLPWTQKNNTGTPVTVPLAGSAPIVSNATADAYGRTPMYMSEGGVSATQHEVYFSGSGAFPIESGTASASNPFSWPKSTDTYYNYANLSAASGPTINALRLAFQMQRMYERDARGGTRYTEIIRSHFGVVSPDMRLQRPEYLGGGRSKINVYPLAQTSGTPTSGTPQGNMAGYGVHSQAGMGFTKSFTEHMLLIGLVNVTSDRSYQQGLNRMFSRQTRADFYWPALSSIGEQSVLNQEIYMQGNSNDTTTFGYQERYAEYRYKPSIIAGEFRSTYSSPLDMWHLADHFTSLPSLNSTFIQDSTVLNLPRCVAVTSEPEIYFDAYLTLKCARPMPVYGVPGNIDRF